MKIEVFVIAWNEERMIDQFLDWYSFADTITILDNYSTDKTTEIALKRGCNIVHYGSDKQDNVLMKQVKEDCWKNSKADWVIVCDMDEFLYHKNFKKLLETTNATIIRSVGYQMISEKADLNKNIFEGARDEKYDKCLCFRPDKIKNMNWCMGCHSCSPQGETVYLEREVKLLHYNMIGRNEVRKRYSDYHQRMCENDLRNGYGKQYTFNREKIDEIFNNFYAKRVNVWGEGADTIIEDHKVTLVVTSCGRFDLLKKTLQSLFQYNTYPIADVIIIEDSGTTDKMLFLQEIIPVPYQLVKNKKPLGQMASIDKAYKMVKTPYIFHCEDDWEFYKSGFVEASFEVLFHDPSVITVWLRSHTDTNGHPIEGVDRFAGSSKYHYFTLHYKGYWHGFSFNPGLRRLSDAKKLMPFSKLEILVKDKDENKTLVGEADLSVHYKNLGYRAAITGIRTGYVKHIGWGHHVPPIN